MAKKQINNTKLIANSDLIADLTWAELYINKIRENLKILTPAVKKTSMSTELAEPVTLLRRQLEGANRTAAALRKIVRPEPER